MPKLRVEFVQMAQAKQGIPDIAGIAKVLLAAELDISATATAGVSQPVAPGNATHVILTAIGGDCYVDWDGHKNISTTADPTTGNRLYIPADKERYVTGFKSGAKFACVEAVIT